MSTMTATKSIGGCGCGGGCGGGCGCTSTSSAGGITGRGSIERPRFFPRQLVTPDDLTLGQEYFRNKLRRMNRYLHGWGVVCGAKVETSTKPWMVIVHPGYILGPYGDEIVIEQDVCFDLRTRCTSGGADACDDVVIDPLCPDRIVDTGRTGNAPLYIALRYKEVPARPVRVAPVGCGCDDTSCEFSRWQDGYEICVLDACPDSHAKPPSLDQFAKPTTIPECPPCPTEPWVVLAIATVDGQGRVVSIDNCGCRRMVRTLAPYWWQCSDPVVQAPAPTPAPVPAPAPAPVPGTNNTPGRPPG